MTTEQAIEPTPGPWQITLRKKWRVRISGPGWHEFASVVVRLEGMDADNPQGLANAQLILAAPDMYDALKFVRRLWAKDDSCEEIRAIDAALAKAEGLSHD